jgi:prepilin-type processing-associated H-X9-DG protein/prepilin-type N-terminal cleavage/methylation domain-containing protein
MNTSFTPSSLRDLPSINSLRRAGGFTLVEMLTTVAIVGVLAALMMPAIGKMRSKAQSVECMGNLRQIGVAMMAFAGDNGGKTPTATIAPYAQEQTWAYQLWPYTYGSYDNFKYYDNTVTMQRAGTSQWQKNIYRCPSTKSMILKNAIAKAPNTGGSAEGYSYGFNSDAGKTALSGLTWWRNVQIPLANVKNRSKVAMVMETSSSVGDYAGYMQGAGILPHSGGSNVLFYDGHVESRSYADIPKSATDVFWDGD